jgi:hypothetical protein
MCERYKKGETLQSIGESYGVCRERIRQILSRYGINGYHGGATLSAFKNGVKARKNNKKRKEQRINNSYGITAEQWDFLRSIGDKYTDTPICKYRYQKRNATNRNIKWALTLWEWWTIWHDSGHWEERGRGMGKYVMARIADTGGYEIENVEIIKFEDNSKDYYDVHYDDWYEKMCESHNW